MVCIFTPSLQLTIKNIAGLLMSVSVITVLLFWIMQDILGFVDNMTNIVRRANEQHIARLANIKYVLLWGPRHSEKDISVSNCIFTQNIGFLNGDYSRFDAIVFDEYNFKKKAKMPVRRTRSQIYLFTATESAFYFPACELYYDNFFNLTFTYRLDSDIVRSYFIVQNSNGNIVAPSETVQWSKSKDPILPKIKAILHGRTRAAAWLVSHCKTDSFRNEYITRLQEHLLHYSLQVDVYGDCTKRDCNDNDCEAMLKKNYYFYMAFENSFAVDYVTEKVLHGYDNYVVPIVFGGANYSRFLPPDSYINARELHPYNLAHLIYQAIQNASIYEAFFGWTNLYTIHYRDDLLRYDICKALNSEKAKFAPANTKFRIWWNTLDGMKWCLSEDYWNETNLINIDADHLYKNIYYN